jgi:cell division transport system permease protein
LLLLAWPCYSPCVVHLINNTVALSIYSRRFSIHTMKLVGASWSFIRRHSSGVPSVSDAVGFAGRCRACGCVYGLYRYEPTSSRWCRGHVMAITAGAVVCVCIVITALCSTISVNKFLKMKAGDLYKINIR